MEEKVFRYMQEKGMVRAGSSVIAGVSGGADSVCLLLLLSAFREKMPLTLTAVHVHHRIRGESADGDMEFTRKLCGRLGIPCLVFFADIPAASKERHISEEEAGRLVRYEIFHRVLEEREGDFIAVAHHADDNAETVLWNLARGSGLAGLSGMQPVKGKIIRPLLCARKEEILEYLRGKGEKWREDETNSSEKYTRNRIRGRLIPELEGLNKKAVSHINSAADILGEAGQWMRGEARNWLDRWAKAGEGLVFLPVAELAGEMRIFRVQVYMVGLQATGASLKDIGKHHFALIDGLIGAGHGSAVSLPGGSRVSRQYSSLVMEGPSRGAVGKCPDNMGKNIVGDNIEASGAGVDGKKEGVQGRFQTKIPGEMDSGAVFQIIPAEAGKKFPERTYTKWFDYDKIENELSVRTRQAGDYIQILPGCRRKTVKSYMIDEKIPRQLRNRIPVIADGSHVLWIVGYRISEGFKVTEDTKTVLQITFNRELPGEGFF